MIKALTKEVPIRSRQSNTGNTDILDLVIVGEGSELPKLKKLAGNNVMFLNKLTDPELGYLYSNAEALIMPQEEDFGYVSLEAQFFGCSVIAYKKGGATETISEGKTGIFFDEQSSESLSRALRKFSMVKYKVQSKIKEFGLRNTERFSRKQFEEKLLNLLKLKIG